MKKRLVIGGILVLAVLAVVVFQSITGMAVRHECVDNDDSAERPDMAQGVVTVTGDDGSKEIYTDYCLDENTLREYSCVSKHGSQTYEDITCVCTSGGCD